MRACPAGAMVSQLQEGGARNTPCESTTPEASSIRREKWGIWGPLVANRPPLLPDKPAWWRPRLVYNNEGCAFGTEEYSQYRNGSGATS